MGDVGRFWGMKAPDRIPTCTTWEGLKDTEQRLRITNVKRHIAYLIKHRDSDEFRPEGSEPEGATTVAATPSSRPRVTMDDLVSLADPQWNPDFHLGLDYLWDHHG